MQSCLEKDHFRDLRVEITRGLHFTRGYPDPWNYTSLAAGKKSAVHILGMTLEESPLQMVVTTDEVGHFIVAPERPYLNVLARNATAEAGGAALEIGLEGAYGRRKRIKEDVRVPGRGDGVLEEPEGGPRGGLPAEPDEAVRRAAHARLLREPHRARGRAGDHHRQDPVHVRRSVPRVASDQGMVSAQAPARLRPRRLSRA